MIHISPQVFVREVRLEDWKGFDYYAPFVRSLGVNLPPSLVIERTAVDATVYRAMGDRRSPILPHLCEIRERCGPMMDHIHMLLTPDTVHFSSPIQSGSAIHVFNAIRTISPYLRILDLSGRWSRGGRDALALSELVCALNHLETYISPKRNLTDGAIAHLMGLPTVRELIWGETVADILRIHESRSQPHLPQLRTFLARITGDLASCCRLIELLKPSQLEALRVYHRGGPSGSHLHSLMEVLSTFCSHRHFVSLNIVNSDHPSLVLENYMVDIAVLRPLFTFPNLTHLSLGLYLVDLDDVKLKDLALCWPRMRVLRFGTRRWGRRAQSGVTYRGLLDLVMHCCDLEDLALFVHLSWSEGHVYPPEQVANNRIVEISIGDSTLENPEQVAIFLRKLFPRLFSIDWEYEDADSDSIDPGSRDCGWSKVGQLIRRPYSYSGLSENFL